MAAGMGRRLKKYYLFCNTAFLSLFTTKFVRYIFIRQRTLQDGTKKASKLYRKLPICIGSFRYIQGVHKVRVHFKKFITLFVLMIERICKQDLKVSCT